MTIEDIVAALQAIVDEAKNADGTEAPMTDDQVARYEALETQLRVAQKSNELRSRHSAHTAVRTSPIIPGSTSTKDPQEGLVRAFNHYLRTGKENADLVELRAQSEGTASEGGYLVPETLRNKIVDRMKAFGGISADCETITTGTGEPISWPTLDDTANVGEIVKENGTFTSGADLAFGAARLGAYEYMTGGDSGSPLRISFVLANDAAFDVEGLVTKKLGERIARIQAVHIVRGTGTEEPQGLLAGRTGVQLAANTGVTYDDLVEYEHSVDPAYREQGCQWGFNDSSLKTLKKIKDSHGDPIWRPDSADMATGTEGGSSGTLMGYRYRIDQAFPDLVLNSATVNWGVFGNISEGHIIRRIKDVTVLVNPYSRMANRQIEYSAWARMDCAQQNTAAYSALTGKG